jgi:hypothetical protein
MYCYNKRKGRHKIEACPLQLRYKLTVLLLYQKWDSKMRINKMVNMLQCPGDITYEQRECLPSASHMCCVSANKYIILTLHLQLISLCV